MLFSPQSSVIEGRLYGELCSARSQYSRWISKQISPLQRNITKSVDIGIELSIPACSSVCIHELSPSLAKCSHNDIDCEGWSARIGRHVTADGVVLIKVSFLLIGSHIDTQLYILGVCTLRPNEPPIHWARLCSIENGWQRPGIRHCKYCSRAIMKDPTISF